jgi:hypothetical protein
VVRSKVVHGSDWPIVPVPPATLLGIAASAECWMEANWLRRDVLIKQGLGFDAPYWHRAATVLRLPARSALRSVSAASHTPPR